MKKYLFISSLIISFLLLGCSDDDNLTAPLLADENTKHEMDLGGTVTLQPKIENAENGSIEWFKNGKLVSIENSYTYKGENAGVDTLKLVVENGAGKESLTYIMQVFGEYSEGVFIIGMSSESNNGTLGFLNEEGFQSNVFQGINPGKVLGNNLLSGRFCDGQIYLVSQVAPYVSVVNAQTMKINDEILTSEASSPGYIDVAGNNGYVVNTANDARTLHPLNKGSIGNAIEGISDIPGVKSSILALKEKLLVASGSDLKTVNFDNDEVKTIASYNEKISGIVVDNNGNIWVGTEGRNEPAKFRMLNENLEVVETVSLDESVKLYRNGVLASAKTKYFYWQETSTGNIHRFNSESKEQEVFVAPMMHGIFFTTAVKEHPVTGDVYIAGAADFMNMDKSKLIVFDSKGEKGKEVENIGESVLDFIFSYKDLYRNK
ncbi:DUF5074 domain-containing protein [Labilibaculum euxinus]